MNNDLEHNQNNFTDTDLEGMAHGNNPVANAYRELLAFRRGVNPPVIPDGWKLVPIEPTEDMINAWGRDISQSYAGVHAEKIGEDEVVFAYQAMLAAAPKPESE